MVVPTARIDHTAEQSQAVVRRYRDELVAVRDGKVAEVERYFVQAWEGDRPPGARSMDRTLSPLHQRWVTVGLDDEGERVVRPRPGDPDLPGDLLAEQRHTERMEAVLPEDPVRVGDSWVVDGPRLKRALGEGLGDDLEGEIRCTLTEVRDEVLALEGAEGEEPEEGAPEPLPERFAIVHLEVETSGVRGEEDDAPRIRTELSGDVRFSLERQKIATVDLEGTLRLRQTRREDGAVMEIDGKGPIEIRKRIRPLPRAE